jgi:hypothetical protein
MISMDGGVFDLPWYICSRGAIGVAKAQPNLCTLVSG